MCKTRKCVDVDVDVDVAVAPFGAAGSRKCPSFSSRERLTGGPEMDLGGIVGDGQRGGGRGRHGERSEMSTGDAGKRNERKEEEQEEEQEHTMPFCAVCVRCLLTTGSLSVVLSLPRLSPFFRPGGLQQCSLA